MDSDDDCYPQNMRAREYRAKGKRATKKRKGVKTTSKKGVGYCFKCKQKRAMKNPRRVVTDRGQPAMTGPCTKCGTTVYAFIKRS